MDTLILPSPAKLNLFLHIVGRRDDGYHLLETVFQLLDFGDLIQIAPASSLKISNHPDIDPTKDLCFAAAQALSVATSHPMCAEIKVEKKLPMGGGLGGGSSNAATVLHGLNLLWKTGLSTNELAAIGLELGADVPVFVKGYSGFAKGIGEKITPIPLAKHYYLVVTPPVHASTMTGFANPRLTRDCQSVKIGGFEIGDHCNVFEALFLEQYSEIGRLLLIISQSPGCRFSRLTGSGSSVFGCFDDINDARAARLLVAGLGQSFVARGMDVSPLHTRLNLS